MAADTWVEEQVSCRDGDCPGPAEPEYDDGLMYFVCTVCAMEFGHRKVKQPSAEGNCQLGVPEDVRARFSQPASGPEPVLLQIGRRPE